MNPKLLLLATILFTPAFLFFNGIGWPLPLTLLASTGITGLIIWAT